ncbi:photosystem II 10 kDa polypeptide, chloroplastic [Setaria italica]|uniref:photosystem II 10 kDa polypeptide, chloroplastic n=1 Tax=Setaria italica TaxID=4555 RepID=UPI0006456667|nr:photosystem II 10 kDa polypeptide, chloroplastic [Setaria italica]
MAASVMAYLALKPSRSPFLDRSRFPDVKSSARASALKVMAKRVKKIQLLSLAHYPGIEYSILTNFFLLTYRASRRIVDASGRPAKGKGVYQFASKYGANVDGYSPIYNPEEWSPSGDVYVGGKTGLLLWAITLAGILLGGALLVYNTSALAS